MAVDMLRLRIELEDVEPPIWRAVQVPTDLTLDDLHTVIQVAMGWTDSHLHRFTVGEPWDPLPELRHGGGHRRGGAG